MVKLQKAKNQIVTDYEVYDRRPNDADLLIAAVDMHHARLGRTSRTWWPRSAAFYVIKDPGRRRKPSLGDQTDLHSRSAQPNESRAQTRAEKALVPPRPGMASPSRCVHASAFVMTPTWSQPQALQSRRRIKPKVESQRQYIDNLIHFGRSMAKPPHSSYVSPANFAFRPRRCHSAWLRSGGALIRPQFMKSHLKQKSQL